VPADAIAPLALGARKVIARRAPQLELFPAAICNLGFRRVDRFSQPWLRRKGYLDRVVLTNEQGLIGGAPASGVEAGAGTNYAAMIDQPYQFDFYDGGWSRPGIPFVLPRWMLKAMST